MQAEPVMARRHEPPAVLRISGPHRLDFLQRQTTNNLNLLSSESALPNVLTSATARILDVFTCVEEDESILLFAQEGRAEILTRYLKSRIFFMDQVTVNDESAAWDRWSLAAGSDIPGLAARSGALRRAEAGYVFDWGAAGNPRLEMALRVGVDPEALGIVLKPTTQDSWEPQRIRQGWPGRGELTTDYSPLEAGLAYTVADQKGCYTGQEVIARQLTYDKVTRGLAGLRIEGAASVGAALLHDERKVGVISSLAEDADLGLIGLAVLRKPQDQPGVELILGEGGGQARVCSLPMK